MPLTPNYCWGSDTAVKSLKIVLTKPGIYTVKMSLRGTLEQRFYAQSLWQGYIETTQKISVFPPSPKKINREITRMQSHNNSLNRERF